MSSSSWSFLPSFQQPNGLFSFAEDKPRLSAPFLPSLLQGESSPKAPPFDPNIEEAYQKEVKKQGEYYQGEDHLIQSAAEGNTAMCRYLIAFHGVDPFYEVPESFQRPITVAMEHGHRETAHYIHEKMRTYLPTFPKSTEDRFSNEKSAKGEAYHPSFHLLQACTYDDLDMARFLISHAFADPLLVVGQEQQGMYGFRGGDSAMIVGKRYGSKNVVEYLKENGVPNEAPPEWIAPLRVRVEADEKLIDLGALSGDGEPLTFDVSAETTSEELQEMIKARLCEPTQKKSPLEGKKRQISFIKMSDFSVDSSSSSSSSSSSKSDPENSDEHSSPSENTSKLTTQGEKIVALTSKWQLIELDSGKPIWHRGRALKPSEMVQKFCDNECGLFLAFKLSLPQFKFVANYPNSSLVVPGEEYSMYVDCFDPEDKMKRSVLIGRLQLVIMGELELVQCQEIAVEMRKSEEGPEGRYIARWTPQYPGLYYAMTRANGVNVHEQWAELMIHEDKGLTNIRRKMASLLPD